MVLGFETLCVLYASEACQCEVFSTAYTLRRTIQGACYFVPQSGIEKTIVNMIDNDHDMRDTVVWVTGPWEAESEDERGAISIVWNLGPVPRGGALPTADIEAKLRKLAAINYYCCN